MPAVGADGGLVDRLVDAPHFDDVVVGVRGPEDLVVELGDRRTDGGHVSRRGHALPPWLVDQQSISGQSPAPASRDHGACFTRLVTIQRHLTTTTDARPRNTSSTTSSRISVTRDKRLLMTAGSIRPVHPQASSLVGMWSRQFGMCVGDPRSAGLPGRRGFPSRQQRTHRRRILGHGAERRAYPTAWSRSVQRRATNGDQQSCLTLTLMWTRCGCRQLMILCRH